ncbi:MAG: putative lipid II flippase FtsW [Candidatus Gastranaerophilales bacterium]|nr:putative lipid II flippase FtsW [Candidatus Gastranaerophilales bacterium]
MSAQKYNIQNSEKLIPTGYITAPDKGLLIIVVFLSVIGIMMILSAGASKCIALGTNPGSFAIKQLIWFVFGIFGMSWFAKYDYKKLRQYAVPFAWIVVFSLILIDFTSLGVTVNGAKRWLALGPFQLQPSEMTKPAIALLLACAFSKDVFLFDKVKIQKYFVPILAMVLLTAIQPNLSMVIIMGLVSLIVYIMAGGSLRMLCTLAGMAFLVLALKIKPYQMSRIKVWLDPEMDPYGAGYNIIQSLLAFVSGGFFGVGFGASRQKLEWLPEAHTDFIYAVIAEEWGFLGCLAIIWLFAWFLYRGITIAISCKDMFGKLLAAGLTFSIASQAFINMSVASSFFPATGVPMPFISYGGTSLFVTMCMVGILLNISKIRIMRNTDV